MNKGQKQYQDMIDVYEGLLKKAKSSLKENKHDVLIPFYENSVRQHRDMIRELMAKQKAHIL